MAKRKVIGLQEAWWIWLGEDPAIRVESEEEVKNLILNKGKDYNIKNSHGRYDMACPVAEIVWSDPLPEGKKFHKTVISPLILVLHNNKIKKMIEHLSPSKLASVSKSWYNLEPQIPAWIPNQYNNAYNNKEVLVIKGKKSILEQLNNHENE